MKIAIERPPIWDEAQKVFEISDRAVFTYGDTLYNPANGHIDEHLMVHEETHMRQQGEDPHGWWLRYMASPDFRLYQELEAYHNQYVSFCKKNRDRNQQNAFLYALARDLSSSLYKLSIGIHSAMIEIRSFK